MTTQVEKSIQVDVPLSTAYGQWTQFEDFPHFMRGVKEVRQLDDRRLHWVAEIAGVRREWEASIVERQVRADLERFKALVEGQGYASGAWRGSINEGINAAPGVEAAALSQGDS